ncbi:alpha/beta hydrolase [Paenibacillus sp. 32O-W]|uniref:alpha/beta fold hydrolase n=1 Tax=Paenibacillus sp. 32O-W TaxID=1695218 RepID=UPI0007202B4C|nr:alpha/beta hydrolase [Paenibacillus sp. 32O-W]ALS28753.1 alpha/beta hydrolase [Paenibacillus sp. 32O-W]
MTAQAGTFTQKQVSLPSGVMEYRESGQGSPVLYLHSAGGVSVNTALEKLAESYRVLIPVFPGFDDTPVLEHIRSMQDLARLSAQFAVHALGEQRQVNVIGHSFGGWVAAWLSVLHPEIVGRLVLEAPAGFRPNGQGGLVGDPETIRRKMYAHPERAALSDKPASVKKRNREMVHFYHESVSLDEELLSRSGEISMPTLILAGTEDGIIPAEGLRMLKAKIRTSYLFYIYDAAHQIEVDQPERFVRVVKDFFTYGELFLIPRKEDEQI